MNVYLTDKEVDCVITACSQWCELMETGDEDLVTPMLDEGLGSALYKLYKGRNGQEIYKSYAKRSVEK